jgi:transcription elongation factor Elf1
MKCPNCDSKNITDTSVDLIYMIVDCECYDCHCEFRLRIDDDATIIDAIDVQ